MDTYCILAPWDRLASKLDLIPVSVIQSSNPNVEGCGGWEGRRETGEEGLRHPSAADYKPVAGRGGSASLVTIESMDQVRINSKDQFTAG